MWGAPSREKKTNLHIQAVSEFAFPSIFQNGFCQQKKRIERWMNETCVWQNVIVIKLLLISLLSLFNKWIIYTLKAQ